MLLVVDVGTHRPISGRFATASCSSTGALRPCVSPPPTSWRGAAQPAGVARLLLRDLEASIVSSTVPSSSPNGGDGQTLPRPRDARGRPGTKTGMAIRYDNPREIGADRLVNAVAIRERFGGPAVCVDFGTATTFDVVSREASTSAVADDRDRDLARGALGAGRRLPKIDLAPPKSVIARTRLTRSAPASCSATRRGRRDPAPPLRRAGRAYGGRGDWRTGAAVVPYTEEIEEVDDLLTLTGLRLLHERNS